MLPTDKILYMAVENHCEENEALHVMSTVDQSTIKSSPSLKSLLPPEKNEKVPKEVEDDELASLAWLQNQHLLKNVEFYIEDENNVSDSPSSDYSDENLQHVTINGDGSEQNDDSISMNSTDSPPLYSDCKPSLSFSCLIFMAIEDSVNKAVPLQHIYNWILKYFPYFHNAPTGWKNSVRHNLSLSKRFLKVDKENGECINSFSSILQDVPPKVARGSLWCIDPKFRPLLMQEIQKAPCLRDFKFSHFSILPHCQDGEEESESKQNPLVSAQPTSQILSPVLFPYLSQRLASLMKGNSKKSKRVPRKRLHPQPTSLTSGVKRSKILNSPTSTMSLNEDDTSGACFNQQEDSSNAVFSDEVQHGSEGSESEEIKSAQICSLAEKGA